MRKFFYLMIFVVVIFAGCSSTTSVSNMDGKLELNVAIERQINDFKGIGPIMGARILKERSIRKFQGCVDLTYRVVGLGALTAKKLSENGLVVNGEICK
jgi:DNA uptake protein ComE-like DNA-binding protein